MFFFLYIVCQFGININKNKFLHYIVRAYHTLAVDSR